MRVSSLMLSFAVVVCVLVGVPVVFSAPALADGCSNEQVRSESDVNPETGVPFSLQLPECRAYEMVSPALKNGSPVGSNVGVTGISSVGTVARVGPEGSVVLISSKGIWPGGEQPADNNLGITAGDEGVQYRVTRGGSGWGFRPEEPGGLREFESSLFPNPADMSTNGIWRGAGVAPAEEEIVVVQGQDPNFYFLEPNGALAEVGPSVPPSDQKGPVTTAEGRAMVVGGSVDLSRVLFSVPDLRWPFDQTKLSTSPSNRAEEISSLYEYVGTGHSGEDGDVPVLMGVDNTGIAISQCGTEAGGYEGENGAERSDESGEAEARSISASGLSVFFTARAHEPYCGSGTGPAVNEVFARVGEPGPGVERGSAVTVNVAGTSECATAAFDSCNVTKPVKYQGASMDGSKVLFTSEQPLVSGDTDSTSNLYECRLPGDSGGALAAVSPVNPCPDLVRVSVPVSSGGAEVQSVAAVSQDGSHVYFVAKGVLSSEPDLSLPPGHQVAEQGEENLYVWEEPSASHPQGRTAFIAPLSSAAFRLGEAQTTPDGESLVFTSSADLLPGDTSTVPQVFLYEAQREALRWVSEGQGGSEDGNTTTDPASLTSGQIGTHNAHTSSLGEGRRVISEDGSVVVFQSSAALTAQVHGGRNNVYLWRGGGLFLISDGTPAGSDEGFHSVAGLIGIDATGQNVFFTTEAPLVEQDSDEQSDLYDARVDGGFSVPRVDECSGEACQGALSAPPAPPSALGSISSGGAGNSLTPLTPLTSSSSTTPKSKPKPKPLTRSEKLAGALKACARDRAERKRARCEALARGRYGAEGKKHRRKVNHRSRAKRETSKSVNGEGK